VEESAALNKKLQETLADATTLNLRLKKELDDTKTELEETKKDIKVFEPLFKAGYIRRVAIDSRNEGTIRNGNEIARVQKCAEIGGRINKKGEETLAKKKMVGFLSKIN
jgi:hypothetical protein